MYLPQLALISFKSISVPPTTKIRRLVHVHDLGKSNRSIFLRLYLWKIHLNAMLNKVSSLIFFFSLTGWIRRKTKRHHSEMPSYGVPPV